MLYFMPWEIHCGKRYVCHSAVPLPQSLEEMEQLWANTNLCPSNPPIAILRYKCNHDLESLMWVALHVVFRLVAWPKAQELWPKIFMNSFYPSKKCECFFTTSYLPVHSFHWGLLDFPAAFKMIWDSLWSICYQSEPQERDYHHLFNTFIFVFSKLLAIVDSQPDIVPFVQWSGTKHKNKAMQLQSLPHKHLQ